MSTNLIQQLISTITHVFVPAVQANPLPLLLVAGFVLCNLGIYLVTRGKEFAIGGFAAGLFMIPFVQF